MVLASLNRTSLKVLILCVLAAAASTNAAMALPKQRGVKCSCFCEVATGGTHLLVEQIYSAVPGMLCGGFNGTVCNIEDPQTHGSRTGITTACGNQGWGVTISTSIFGGVGIFRGGAQMTPVRR
jgi:hypothetical protein